MAAAAAAAPRYYEVCHRDTRLSVTLDLLVQVRPYSHPVMPCDWVWGNDGPRSCSDTTACVCL
jgi:hypothetical protein|eukprot:COSAG01_NODE_141_length_24253_cov_36.101130_9_plen_63_part_00